MVTEIEDSTLCKCGHTATSHRLLTHANAPISPGECMECNCKLFSPWPEHGMVAGTDQPVHITHRVIGSVCKYGCVDLTKLCLDFREQPHVASNGSCRLCDGTHFGLGLWCPFRCDYCHCNTGTCDEAICPRNVRWKEALQTREGDQPLPVKNDLPCVQDLVILDMEARKAIGIKRYGTTLQPHNGRDVIRDIYEEMLDAAAYMRQLIYERDGK